MKKTDAVILDNYFPTPVDVVLRNGYVKYSTGFSGTAETVATYYGTTAQKCFAIAGGNIYDISSGGAVGTAVVSGLTNNRFQKANFGTPGGQFLYLVNGLDKPLLYNGTAWTAIDGASTPAITGVTTTLLNNVNVFKQRLWFVEKNSTRIWYLPINSISGAASSLDFSSVFKQGGNLVAMGNWTLDAGTGVDDLALFISSNGEVLVYKGTDPASASTWALVGSFMLSPPVGNRNVVKFGGDALLITLSGLLPLAQSLQSSTVNTHSALTDKIQSAMNAAVTNYGTNFGWETVVFPAANALLVNIPVSTSVSYQYVMNTITGAWCRFLGWNAATFEIFNNQLYFGGSGYVAKAWTGTSDAGANIVGEGLQAFNDFGNGDQQKKFHECRPLLSWDNPPSLRLGVNTDFDTTKPEGLPETAPITAALWDSSVWDAGVWGGGPVLQRAWQTVGGLGYRAGLHILTSSNSSQVRWAGTDYLYERAGVI
jgi:hypothetical protein